MNDLRTGAWATLACIMLLTGCGKSPTATESDAQLDKGEVKVRTGKLHVVENIGIELAQIPAGSFTMGSPTSETARNDHETQHRVTISQPFWLGKYEVTQGQWESVMGSDPSKFRAAGKDAPVEMVSREDALAFCAKLNAGAASNRPKGYSYCLPTEAQWEYACRAGTTGTYAGDLDDMAWYERNSGKRTHPVGQKQANAWGLYDIHGNVWEWCWDWSGDYPTGSVSDPVGANSGRGRVFRGGSWGGSAGDCRSAFRGWLDPGFRSGILGFRLCLAPGRER
jgi:formylglycine-generating enzyme required for sulfatase activity